MGVNIILEEKADLLLVKISGSICVYKVGRIGCGMVGSRTVLHFTFLEVDWFLAMVGGGGLVMTWYWPGRDGGLE